MCALAVMKLSVAQAGLKETEIHIRACGVLGSEEQAPQGQANIFSQYFNYFHFFSL